MPERLADEVILSFIEYELLAIGVPESEISRAYRIIRQRNIDENGKRKNPLRTTRVELKTPDGNVETTATQIRRHLTKRLREHWKEGWSLPQSPSYPQIAKAVGLRSHASAIDLQRRKCTIKRYEGSYEPRGVLSQINEDEEGFVKIIQNNPIPIQTLPSVEIQDKKEPYTNGFLHKNETDEARANLNLERIVKEGLRIKGASDEEVSRIYDQLQKIQDGPDKENNVTLIAGIHRPLSRLRASLAHWMYTVAEKGTLGELEVSYALNYPNLLESMNAVEEENQRINAEIANRVRYGTTTSK